MTIHAYSQLYLNKSSRAVGNMLHDTVLEFGMNGTGGKKRLGIVSGGNGKKYR